MGDGLENQKALVPIYNAFDREVPDGLEAPEDVLKTLLAELDQKLGELEKQSSAPGAANTAKRAAGFRKDFAALSAAAKNLAGKPAASKLEKLTAEAGELYEKVGTELTVPIREAGVAKALEALQKHKDPAARSKAGDFARRREAIAKEGDPRKRCDLYFQLERDIIKSDLRARELDDPGSTWQDQVEIALDDAKPLGKFDLKGKAARGLRNIKARIVSAVTRTSLEAISNDDFLALKTAFLNSYSLKIEDQAYSVPEASRSEFVSQARQAIAAIADQTFVPARPPKDQQALGQCLMQAQTRGLQELARLKRDYPPSPTPAVNVFKGKLMVTKPASTTESLVLQGGGGKGGGYPPMLEEMNKAGILKGVNVLVGTSIGALNAACLACGGLSDEKQILNLDIFGEGYDTRNFKKQYPGITFKPKSELASVVNAVLPSCAGQMAKLDRLTSQSVADNLKDYKEADLSEALSKKLSRLDDETLERLGLAGASSKTIELEVKKLARKVKNQDFKASDRTSQMITFKDLALLHQLDPANFKELSITGWEGTGKEGKPVCFNAREFADMPVALAARISMGLPVFSPLYWNGRGPFFDGGLGSNAPVEATPGLADFYKGKDPGEVEQELKGDVPVQVQEAMAKTMLMTFDDGGKGADNLFGGGRQKTSVAFAEKLTLVTTGIQPNYGKTLKSDATKVYNTGVNALEVYHGGLGTMSLGALAGADEREYAENMSRLKGLEQLAERQDQAEQLSCASPDEALLAMTSAEKRSFVAGPKPAQADPLVLELYDKCKQYLLLQDALDNVAEDAAPFLDLAAASPLCAAVKPAILSLRDAYNVCLKSGNNPAVLTQAIEKTSATINDDCPAFLRPLLKQAVLIPMQQKRRSQL